MTEFSDLGKHCSDQLCRQQDFLPFTCADCSRVFCRDHRSSHACSVDRSLQNTMPQCPLCTQFIHARADENPNTVMDAHMSSGCKLHLLEVSAKHRDKKRSCAFKKCKKVELVPFHCNACRLSFCVGHRFAEDHSCPGTPQVGVAASSSSSKSESSFFGKIADFFTPSSSPSSASSTSSVVTSARAPTSAASASAASASAAAASFPAPPAQPKPAAAAKPLPPHIRVMQLKARAVGDAGIAESDRLWFEIRIPSAQLRATMRPTKAVPAAVEAVPFFLSRQYTIGRCLDSVCQHLGIANRNNERGAPKLVLALPPPQASAAASAASASPEAPSAVTPLPFDIQLSLLESELPSGSALVLAYENASP